MMVIKFKFPKPGCFHTTPACLWGDNGQRNQTNICKPIIFLDRRCFWKFEISGNFKINIIFYKKNLWAWQYLQRYSIGQNTELSVYIPLAYFICISMCGSVSCVRQQATVFSVFCPMPQTQNIQMACVLPLPCMPLPMTSHKPWKSSSLIFSLPILLSKSLGFWASELKDSCPYHP